MADPVYQTHLAVLAERWARALEHAGFEAAIVAAGAPQLYFLDDQSPPWRCNPHFGQWLPGAECPHSALLVRPGARPRLYFHSPADYWHQPPTVPDWLGDAFELLVFDDLAQLQEAVAAAAGASNRLAWVGEAAAGLPGVAQNPPALLAHLHYHRACKTDFEIGCMTAATERATLGHRAAAAAFGAGASEFEIHMAYLGAARQTAADLPYSSIVALNEHAGVLHYQHYDRDPPAVRRSFLIDAGATSRGYAADITRTYAAVDAADGDRFAALVAGMDELQLALIDCISPGLSYVDLHVSAHRAIGRLLVEHGILTCSADAAFETGLTRVFLPHGLGHLIGLQTHDVGGLQADPLGTPEPPPELYPALRLTRPIEVDQVFTIEPGIYFIPLLLDAAAKSDAARDVDWALIERLLPFGGIRIEDNVLVTADGVRNLTRDAFNQPGDH